MDFEQIKLSRKTTGMAKSLDLTATEMAYIDLVTAGWGRRDAYYLAFRRGWSWPEDEIDDVIAKIHEKAGYSERRKAVRESITKHVAVIPTMPQNEDDGMVTKESMIKELVAAKQAMKPGTKEWVDLQKMISDIMRLKQDEITKDDDLVHFYMPMKCHECPFFEQMNAK